MRGLSRKVFLGGILFVSACVIISLLHYNGAGSTIVFKFEGETQRLGHQPDQLQHQHKPDSSDNDKIQQQSFTKNKSILQGTKIQLELLESLKKQDLEVASDDESSDFSSDSELVDEILTDDAVNVDNVQAQIHESEKQSQEVVEEEEEEGQEEKEEEREEEGPEEKEEEREEEEEEEKEEEEGQEGKEEEKEEEREEEEEEQEEVMQPEGLDKEVDKDEDELQEAERLKEERIDVKENQIEQDEDDRKSSTPEKEFTEKDKWPTDKTIVRYDNNNTNLSGTSISKRLINCYDWNDRDPNGWKHLPLKSARDSQMQSQRDLSRVVFNRVGKCGSRSVIVLLRQLAAVNNFHFISSTVYNTTHIHDWWQERIVHTLDQVQPPYLFQRHLHYVDFTRYGSPPVLYINIIRDPLARMVSQYYFKRFGDGRSKDRFKGTLEEKYQTFDECVLKHMKECTGKKAFYILPFFCGQDHRCTSPSTWALETAIRNVEEKYIFVGILEEFENSLAVLERLLPTMFRNAVHIYQHPEEIEDHHKVKTTVTQHKKKPSPEVEEIMKKEMQFEYQFYNYVRIKFHKTQRTLGITPDT